MFFRTLSTPNAVSCIDNELVMEAVFTIQESMDEFHSNKVLMSTMIHIIQLMAEVGTTKSLKKAYILLTAMELCLRDKRLFNLKNSDHHIKTVADVCRLKSVIGDELINNHIGMVRKFWSAIKLNYKRIFRKSDYYADSL